MKLIFVKNLSAGLREKQAKKGEQEDFNIHPFI
jgi:hypothetical protein